MNYSDITLCLLKLFSREMSQGEVAINRIPIIYTNNTKYPEIPETKNNKRIHTIKAGPCPEERVYQVKNPKKGCFLFFWTFYSSQRPSFVGMQLGIEEWKGSSNKQQRKGVDYIINSLTQNLPK